MLDELMRAFNKRGFVKDQDKVKPAKDAQQALPAKDDVRSRRAACLTELNEVIARVLVEHRMMLDIITTHSHTGTASMLSVYPMKEK